MIFLNVPYAEKDEARALGARWNPVRKRWYVPDGADAAPFAKWQGAPDAAAPSGRRDSAVARLAVGANYVEMAHACSPFEPCPECERELAGGPWQVARAALLETVARLRRA